MNKEVSQKRRRKRSGDPFSRQRTMKFFVERYGKWWGSSIAKKYRRLKKYKARGQYVDGIFYCKAGKPITFERVNQYENMCHKLVRTYFPALFLNEAAFDYDDLVMNCRIEVFLALLDGFDPVKAMTSNELDPELNAVKVAEKMADVEKTLVNSEKSIVYGRLKFYLRRIRFNYHPSQRGGVTGSLEHLMANPLGEAAGHSYQEFKRGIFTEPVEPDSKVEVIKRGLVEMLEDRGAETVKALYEGLPDEEKEALLDNLLSVERANRWKATTEEKRA